MKRLLIILISAYQSLAGYLKIILKNFGLSPGACRYTPSCSEYAKACINKHPLPLAIWYSVKRLLKCHPWSDRGYDPIP